MAKFQLKKEGIFIILLSLILSITLFCYFYNQCILVVEVEDGTSDMLAYMKTIEGIESGYSFPYPIMFGIGKLFHLFVPVNIALSLTVTILNTATFLSILYWARRTLKTKLSLSLLLTAMGVLFYSMLFIPNHELPGLPFRYVGVFSPNPFHNATYLAARVFCVMSFFSFAELFDCYRVKIEKKQGLIFSIWLLLATMTKPSFTIVFCGAVGCIMVYHLLKSKCKIIKQTIYLGLTFIPTFLHLLYQYKGVFLGTNTKGEETGIGIGFLVAWGELCENIPLAIVLAIAFPIVVLIFHRKSFAESTLYRLSWQVYGMGLLMFGFLYEKGFRLFHMNFSWGYMIGMFLLVLVSALELCKDKIIVVEGNKKKYNKAVIFQWIVFGAHILCGSYYFISILLGQSYY